MGVSNEEICRAEDTIAMSHGHPYSAAVCTRKGVALLYYQNTEICVPPPSTPFHPLPLHPYQCIHISILIKWNILNPILH